MRLKQAPPLAVLAGLPLLGGPSRYAADRCGDAVLSRAGPKPCQTRDGRSWRTGPLFSLCPRVPSPVLPRCEWRVGGGRGAESGPTSLPRPVPRGVGGVGVSVTRRMLRLCLLAVSRGRPSPRWGGPCCRRAARLPGRVSAFPRPLAVPLERSRSSLRRPRPSGGVVPCSRRPPQVTTALVCLRSGGVESVREACPSSPSGGTGASSPPTACRVGAGRLGRVPARSPCWGFPAGVGVTVAGRASGVALALWLGGAV